MNFLNLAGGLALFLYGMTIMGTGLEKVAGSKLEGILQKLAGSVPKAVLLGAVVTGLIQSSSGTTVIVVGLVNSGILSLSRAIGIIMGANIGTTVTGQLIRLSEISGSGWLFTLLKPTTLSPVVAVIGAILFVFCKSPKKHNAGQICLGFGILFTGLFTMENAVAPLKDSPALAQLFVGLQNPFLGVLVGCLVTILIQSSSASVGILQALSATGVITWGSAIPIILGQNIGTTSTPLLASIGANTAAKRSAVVHLYFNVIGTGIFLAAVYGLKHMGYLPFWNEVMGKGDIANFHTLFNVVVTLLFIPFTRVLAWLAEHTIPEKPGEKADLSMPVLDERLLERPAVALQQTRTALDSMAVRCGKNLDLAFRQFSDASSEAAESIMAREKLLDKTEVSITGYLLRLGDYPLTEAENHQLSEILKMTGEYERIGDRAVNILQDAQEAKEAQVQFSESARNQLEALSRATVHLLELTAGSTAAEDVQHAREAEPLAYAVSEMCEKLREGHIARLTTGRCSVEGGIIYLDMLTNVERIAAHCANIAGFQMVYRAGFTDLHERKHHLLAGNDPEFNRLLAEARAECAVAAR